MRGRGRVLAATALVALLASACGSTLEPRGSVATAEGGLGAQPGSTGEGVRGGGPGGGAGATGPGGSGTAAGTGGVAAATAGTAGAGFGSTSGAGSGSTAGRLARGGVSATEMKVGIEYVDAASAAAAASAVGYEGGAGDPKATYAALINELNKRGGIAGRKVVPVWFAYDAAGTDANTQEEAMCQRFTQDNKVFAALVLSSATDLARTCLERAGVITIAQGGFTSGDDRTYASFPHYANAGSLGLDRMTGAYVDGLVRLKYFDPGARIGLITTELPAFVRAAKGPLRAALRRHGLTVAEEAYVKPYFTAAGLGDAAPGVQNAVLRFNTSRISHVLFLGPFGGNTLLFMTSAESQNYRPRYGFTSNDEFAKMPGTAPAEQLQRSLGVGWFPLNDDSGALSNIGPAGKRCLKTLAAAGTRPAGAGPTGIALQICDHVNVLVAAASRAGAAMSATAVMRGLESLGTSYESAAFLRLVYRPQQRDGVGAVRGVAFNAACTCFRYSGPVAPV